MENTTKLTCDGMAVLVEGKAFFFPTAAIEALHRIERKEWGRGIAANYDVRDGLSEEDYERLATELEDRMMSENGELEFEVLKDLGFIDCNEEE